MPAYIKFDGIRGDVTEAAAGEPEPYLEVKLESTLISSYSVSGAGDAASGPGREIHVESFSWGVSQSGGFAESGFFDGRLLTAQDLTDEQAGSRDVEPYGDFLGGVVVGSSGGGGVDVLIGNTGGDRDGVVDGADFLVWRDAAAASAEAGDLAEAGDAASTVGSGTNWRSYRVSVDSIE